MMFGILFLGLTHITYMWVFSVKLLVGGSLDKYKADLVTCGFLKEFGINYSKTYNLVLKTNTIKD